MVQSVNIYIRDGEEMSYEQWFQALWQDIDADCGGKFRITAKDVEEEAKELNHDGSWFNGHVYSHQIYCDHDNVQELMKTLSELEYQDEVFEAVKKMSDDIIHKIVLAIESYAPVTIVDGKYRV